jgi:hypothetical protein
LGSVERWGFSMGDTRSRAGAMVGLVAAAGAFGVAALMSAATAPTARADDFTDVINNVDADLTAGQTDFSAAFSDFGSSNVNDGLAALFSGVDNDFLGAPDELYVGTLDLLANEPVASFSIGVPAETDFASGLSDAETIFAIADTNFADAGTDLSSGDYADAAYFSGVGSVVDLIALQTLIEGVVASF